MGVKATLASTSYAGAHVNAGAAAGHSVPALSRAIQFRIDELVRDLRTLVGTMQGGDPNIATINAQITALS